MRSNNRSGYLTLAAGAVLWFGCADRPQPTGSPERLSRASAALGSGVCGSVVLNADSPASPSAAGADVTLSATATCTAGTPQYQFWVQPVGGSWSLQCAYSTSSTCLWSAPASGAYYIQVTAVSSLSGAGTDSSSTIEEHQVGSQVCTSVVLDAPSPASPSPAGADITLSASATCTGTAEYQFWVQPVGGSWTLQCPYSTSSTCTWPSPSAGAYYVQATVRSTGSIASTDASSNIESQQVGSQVCSSVVLDTDFPASPSPEGTDVTLSASATCNGGTPEYQFWVQPVGGAWSLQCPYSSSSTCDWSSPTAGAYNIQVTARSSGSGAGTDSSSAIELHQIGSQVCGSVALNADSPASPSATGTDVTLSATATCTGGTAQYQFWVQPVGGSWSLICPYSTSSTCTWPSPAAGPYNIQVTARSSGSVASTDSSSTIEEHQIGSEACGSVSLNADSPLSPSSPGTDVVLSATATCSGGTAQYQFWVQPSGGSWSVVCPYSTSSACTWSSPSAGAYSVQVTARSSGSIASTDSSSAVAQHQVGSFVCGSVVLNADSPSSPSTAGTDVTLSASATCTGGTAEYQFWLQPSGGSWTLLCPYSTASTCNWSSPSAGTYSIQVTARSSASSASTDSSSSIASHVVQVAADGGGADGGTSDGGGGGSDAGSTLLQLASGQASPFGIAVDSANVYWTNDSDGTVMSVPIGGGTPVTLATSQNQPLSIAVNATTVYWTNFGGGSIASVPIAGGSVTTIATAQGAAKALTLDGTNLYWCANNAILKKPLSGGTPTTLTTGVGNVFYFNVAVNATNVFWVNDSAATTMPIAGGAVTTLVSPFNGPNYGVAIDSTNLYWADNGGSAVYKVPLSGGSLTTIASGGSPNAVAVDSTYVYWTDPGFGTVLKAPIAGGSVTTLATGQSDPYDIAVDSTSVYWTNNMNSGTVMKLTPK